MVALMDNAWFDDLLSYPFSATTRYKQDNELVINGFHQKCTEMHIVKERGKYTHFRSNSLSEALDSDSNHGLSSFWYLPPYDFINNCNRNELGEKTAYKESM